jgi:hypothetical protein
MQLDGGIGKHVAATSLLKYLKSLYDKVYTFSSHPYIFQGISDRSFGMATACGYEDYFMNADAVYYPTPYRNNDFRMKKTSLQKAFFESINFSYDNSIPELIFRHDEIEIAKRIKKELGNFIIVQFSGGWLPNEQADKPMLMAKNYSLEKAENFVKLFRAKYKNINILNFSFLEESNIKGTIQLRLSTMQWFAVLKYAALSFIGIDSSLQHAGNAVNKNGLVLWGATDPKTFGYEYHKNITGKCHYNNQHCQRPYFVPSSDFDSLNMIHQCDRKSCINIDEREILESISQILGDSNIYKDEKTIDISKIISTQTAWRPKNKQNCNCKG